MFARYGRDRDLSLLDRFRLYNTQKQIGEALRRSHAVVQDHLTAISAHLESDLRALVDMPESSDYSLSLNAERDNNSFKFRWHITVEKYDKNHAQIDAFKITITPHHIEYTDASSNQGRSFTIIPASVSDHELKIDSIRQNMRQSAIDEIKTAFYLWTAQHCPDHAGLYFLDRLPALDDMQALHDKQQEEKADLTPFWPYKTPPLKSP